MQSLAAGIEKLTVSHKKTKTREQSSHVFYLRNANKQFNAHQTHTKNEWERQHMVLTHTADAEAEGALSLRCAALNSALVRVQADARACRVVGQALVVNR